MEQPVSLYEVGQVSSIKISISKVPQNPTGLCNDDDRVKSLLVIHTAGKS